MRGHRSGSALVSPRRYSSRTCSNALAEASSGLITQAKLPSEFSSLLVRVHVLKSAGVLKPLRSCLIANVTRCYRRRNQKAEGKEKKKNEWTVLGNSGSLIIRS